MPPATVHPLPSIGDVVTARWNGALAPATARESHVSATGQVTRIEEDVVVLLTAENREVNVRPDWIC